MINLRRLSTTALLLAGILFCTSPAVQASANSASQLTAQLELQWDHYFFSQPVSASMSIDTANRGLTGQVYFAKQTTELGLTIVSLNLVGEYEEAPGAQVSGELSGWVLYKDQADRQSGSAPFTCSSPDCSAKTDTPLLLSTYNAYILPIEGSWSGSLSLPMEGRGSGSGSFEYIENTCLDCSTPQEQLRSGGWKIQSLSPATSTTIQPDALVQNPTRTIVAALMDRPLDSLAGRMPNSQVPLLATGALLGALLGLGLAQVLIPGILRANHSMNLRHGFQIRRYSRNKPTGTQTFVRSPVDGSWVPGEQARYEQEMLDAGMLYDPRSETFILPQRRVALFHASDHARASQPARADRVKAVYEAEAEIARRRMLSQQKALEVQASLKSNAALRSMESAIASGKNGSREAGASREKNIFLVANCIPMGQANEVLYRQIRLALIEGASTILQQDETMEAQSSGEKQEQPGNASPPQPDVQPAQTGVTPDLQPGKEWIIPEMSEKDRPSVASQ